MCSHCLVAKSSLAVVNFLFPCDKSVNYPPKTFRLNVCRQARNTLSQLIEDADRDVALEARMAYRLVVQGDVREEEDGSSDA